MNKEKTCWDCVHCKCDSDDYDIWCDVFVKGLESEGIEICSEFEEEHTST